MGRLSYNNCDTSGDLMFIRLSIGEDVLHAQKKTVLDVRRGGAREERAENISGVEEKSCKKILRVTAVGSHHSESNQGHSDICG